MKEQRRTIQNDQRQRRTIQYSQIQKEGIILESQETFSGSVFAKEYDYIFDILWKICDENFAEQEMQRDRRNCGQRRKPVAERKINNVISVVGGRGTGKTSFMLSFLDELNTYDLYGRTKGKHEAYRYSGDRDIRFIVLNYIDVGMLKQAKDIVSIVVAKMYQYLDSQENSRNDFSSKKQNLLKQFDDIYRDLNRASEFFVEGQSALRSLKNFSSSYAIGEKFRELVTSYVDYIGELDGTNERCRQNYFLVIALDDIDLYNTSDGNCYELLEQIYKYFMIPGLIVVTAYNEQLLQRKIKEYLSAQFYKKYPVGMEYEYSKAGHDKIMNEKKERNELYKQFLEKILPSYQVVFLPDFTKVDYTDTSENLCIYIDREDHVEWLKDKEGNPKTGEINVKEFVLRFIAYITGIHYDVMGQKKHFFEPRNLRDLHTILKLLDKMCPPLLSEEDADAWQRCVYYRNGMPCYTETVPSEQKQLTWYDENCTQLLRYIYNQLGDAALTSEEQYLLDDLLSLGIMRRCKELLDVIRDRRDEYLDEEKPYHLTAVDRQWKYSYGELLHNIYYATRFKNGYTKELIHCLLASNTTILTKCYYRYVYALKGNAAQKESDFEKETAREKAERELKNVLGTSLSGSWSNDMIPSVYVWIEHTALGRTERTLLSEKIGSVNISALNNIFNAIKLDNKFVKSLCALGYREAGWEETETFSENDWKPIFRDLQLFGMFFTNLSGDDTNDCFGFEIELFSDRDLTVNDVQKSNSPVWQLKCSAKNACFNMMNFVVNSFQYQSYISHFCEDLAQACWKWLAKYDRENESKFKVKSLIQRLKEHSLLHEYEKWEAGKRKVRFNQEQTSDSSPEPIGPFAVPFYQFDMTYNIVKRLADSALNRTGKVDSMEAEQFPFYCDVVYQDLADRLGEQDEVYLINYKKHFLSCPFMDYFHEAVRVSREQQLIMEQRIESGFTESDYDETKMDLISWMIEWARILVKTQRL